MVNETWAPDCISEVTFDVRLIRYPSHMVSSANILIFSLFFTQLVKENLFLYCLMKAFFQSMFLISLPYLTSIFPFRIYPDRLIMTGLSPKDWIKSAPKVSCICILAFSVWFMLATEKCGNTTVPPDA